MRSATSNATSATATPTGRRGCSRHDPTRISPVPYTTFYRVFADWQHRIGLHDKTGCPTTVTVHRLRHTFGTRLINSGVPQHVIQRLLGHASPTMTAVYAHLHDSTIRAEFERYCQTPPGSTPVNPSCCSAIPAPGKPTC